MTRQGGASDQLPRGRVAKRQAITQAARAVFGREGYARAGIENIAAEARVSTRTIYNHFDGKEQLFSAVIQESSTQVADTLVRIVEDHLGDRPRPDDLEATLVGLARAWAMPQRDFAEHFTLVRSMLAEGPQLPPALLEVWNTAGPQRAEVALARRLRALADDGMLACDDAVLAADHFLLLTRGAIDARGDHGANPLDDTETDRIITAGVRAFLGGYLPRTAG